MAPFAFPPTAFSLSTLPHRILVTVTALAASGRCCFRSAAANAAASFAVAYALCFSFAAAAAGTAAAATAAAATATTATVAVTLCRIEN